MTTKEIEEIYLDSGSVKKTAAKCHCSWNKVVKTLSTANYILNETHSHILNLQSQGLSVQEIAEQIGYSEKTVQAYLPRVRPIYNENLSGNAIRIKAFRERKEITD